MRRVLDVGLWVAVVFLNLGCPVNGTGPEGPVTIVTVAGPSSVVVGGTIQLTAATYIAGGVRVTGRKVDWTSLEPDVASVDQQGKVTGVSAGLTDIAASSEGIAGTAQVTVTPVNPVTWQLQGTTGASSGNWTDAGATLSLSVTFNPPQQVTEGQTYAVSSTSAATLTALAPPGGTPPALNWAITAVLSDGSTGSDVTLASSNKFINANPVASGSVTAGASWTIPTSYHNFQTLKLSGIGYGAIGNFLTVVATYSRSP